MEKTLKAELIFCGTLVLVILIFDWIPPQSVPLALNLTAIGETITAINPLATLIGTALTIILAIASLYGKIKGYLEHRRWNKKYGESRTPVVIGVNGS